MTQTPTANSGQGQQPQLVEGKKKFEPGWYFDPRWPGEQRRFDGTKWLDLWRPVPADSAWTPGSWMFAGAGLGLLFGVLAAIAFEIDPKYGWPVFWLGCAVAGTVFNIGAIAKAVEVGIRAARR
jgi:hypothetical protein